MGTALLLLGPTRALRAIGAGFGQVFAGVWSGQSLLHLAAALSRSEGGVVLLGVVLSKLIAYDLLISAIPQTIGLLVPDQKLFVKVNAVFALASFLVYVAWSVHLVVWIVRSLG